MRSGDDRGCIVVSARTLGRFVNSTVALTELLALAEGSRFCLGGCRVVDPHSAFPASTLLCEKPDVRETLWCGAGGSQRYVRRKQNGRWSAIEDLDRAGRAADLISKPLAKRLFAYDPPVSATERKRFRQVLVEKLSGVAVFVV